MRAEIFPEPHANTAQLARASDARHQLVPLTCGSRTRNHGRCTAPVKNPVDNARHVTPYRAKCTVFAGCGHFVTRPKYEWAASDLRSVSRYAGRVAAAPPGDTPPIRRRCA